jgi:TonB family protein
MKLSASILISALFHAAIFSLPTLYFAPGGEQAVPVVLLGVGEGEGDRVPAGKAGGESGQPKLHAGANKRTYRVERDNKGSTAETPVAAAVLAGGRFPVLGNANEPLLIGESGETSAGETQAVFNEATGGSGGVEQFAGGAGNGGVGSGISGGGGGGLSAGAVFVRANYVYNPKPEYPESARKEGWEGTVLLSVLVDRQGKAETIDVSRSSGFPTLDRAAAETVRHWRFRPARLGEKRIESWVRIPIIFRLADIKD